MSKTPSTPFIVSAARTPIGAFQGSLASISAPRLGAAAIKKALVSAGLTAEQVDEVIMGQVLTAGAGQAPARQAALYAGLKPSTPCMTINKVCGSGLKAVMLAADSICAGHSQIVMAGGQENMTLSPHLLENSRNGYRMGHIQSTDSMIKDGLWDPYNDFHMGVAAEKCVKEFNLSRQEQDEFATQSYQMAQKAEEKNLFKDEIAPVEVKQRKETILVEKDEEPSRVRFDKIPTLRAAFEKDGTITAANASKINDGAAALVVASEDKVQELNLKPLAKIISQATFAQAPEWFTTAPVGAIKKALNKAQLNAGDIDLWEINEAFSAVTLAAMKEFDLKRDQVNIHGGAVALGHPIGCSGARILTTLVHALGSHKKKYGLATLCLGGGEAVAMIVEGV